MIHSFLENYPLIAALIAMISAQVVKFPLHLIIHKKFEPFIIFSNGGMPSSHSAFVSSLTTALGIQYGLNSPYFAVATVFSLITMWDATGIRYQASKHAKILNILVQDFQNLVEHVKYKRNNKRTHVPLKELLGHKPFEVLVGAVFGSIVAALLEYWFY